MQLSNGHSYIEELNKMLDNIDNELYKAQGSFTYDMLSPVANELEQAYINLDNGLNSTFTPYAKDMMLDMRVNDFGVYRKQGIKAKGFIIVSGNNGVVIPVGSQLKTSTGLVYEVVTEGSIVGGSARVEVQALEVGSKYNVLSGALTQFEKSIDGVSNVLNEDIVGGVDIESDKELLERFYLKVQNPSTSGNANHYKIWALEVDGVGRVRVFPTWNGGGTVKIVVIGDDMAPVSDDIVTKVVSYIEENRPIGATITVKSGVAKLINIDVNVVVDLGYTLNEVRNEFNDKVYKYLQSIAFVSNYVSYAQIGNLLMSIGGVVDYSNLLVNGIKDNIVLGNEETPILNSLILEV